jgi:serine/threonine protein phosphatase PrpC
MIKTLERTGEYHLKNDVPSQDAFAIKHNDKYTVFCVSDGASSAELSRVASTLITKDVATELVKRDLDIYFESKDYTKFSKNIVDIAHTTCAELCRKCHCSPEDLSSTLIVALIKRSTKSKKTKALIFMVGDGFVTVTNNKKVHLVSDGDNINGNACLTYFITDPNALNYANIFEVYGFDFLLLSTDGLTHAVDIHDNDGFSSFIKQLKNLKYRHSTYTNAVFSNIITDCESLVDDCTAVIYSINS